MSEEASKHRPELAWARWAGIAGALAATALTVRDITTSASSTAAIGYIFLPFIAIAAAIPAAVWGLALGTVLAHVRGMKPVLRPVLILAWIVTLSVPAAIGWELEKGLALQGSIRDLSGMDTQQLDAAFDDGRFRRDRFFLGALAQHPATHARLLARIAAIPDDDLYDRMGSSWDVMGDNRKGLAVMRLVASNPKTSAATLAQLSSAPRNNYVLGDVLRNPNTPQRSLEPHFGSSEYLLEWGMALNPNVPRAVMERLSRSANVYTRLNLTRNPGAPSDLLERLSRDKDDGVARNASAYLAKRFPRRRE